MQNASHPTTAAIVFSPRPSKALPAVLAGIYDQTLPPNEIIVVRPGGGGDLDEWRGRPGFRVLAADGVNASAARNFGWRTATAERVAFFDDDSVPDVGWFEELLSVFRDEGRCAACGGTTIDETRPDRPLVFRHGLIAADGQLDAIRLEAGPVGGNGSRNVLDRANMLCSRAALLEVGGFDESFETAWAEYDLCLRLSNAGYAVMHHTRGLVHLLRARTLPADEAVLATAARDRTYFLRQHGGKNPLEAARTVLYAAREQQRALRLAGAEEPARRVFRAWAEGVRLGMELPAPTFQPRAAPPTTTAPAVWRPARTGPVRRSRWQIALICGVFEAGHNGISEYTRLLAESFTQRGHGVTVFRTNRGPPLGERRPYDVIDVQPRPKELYQAAVGRHVLDCHRRHGLDLVEAPVWLGEACGVGLLAPYPVVTRLVTPADVLHRTSQVSLEHERANQTSMERLQLGISRGVIGISQAVCDTVEEVYGVRLSQPGRPLAVIPLGLPSIDPSSVSVAPAPCTGQPTILYVGRLHQRKGILDLAEAFARLAQKNRAARLWVLGRDYSDADGYRDRTGKSYLQALKEIWRGGVERQVHLLGELDDAVKNSLILQADLVVVPSWYESFGLVLLEAMRLAKPVVACAVGGMTEIVVDGETGLLVPPNDPPRLAEAIARLCADASLRQTMGQTALARFERLYRLERCVEATEDFYAEVISAARRERRIVQE